MTELLKLPREQPDQRFDATARFGAHGRGNCGNLGDSHTLIENVLEKLWKHLIRCKNILRQAARSETVFFVIVVHALDRGDSRIQINKRLEALSTSDLRSSIADNDWESRSQ